MYFWILGALQIILALRVVLRLARSAGGVRIEAAAAPRSERVSIIVPVLNETARIKDCLECLIAQPEVLAEMLVVDGGSTDGTQSIVERYGSRDRRVRLIDASPVPCNWTGKAWGLYVGLEKTDPRSNLCLCLPCWPMPKEPEFQLSRLRPANNFLVSRRLCSTLAS
jgi:glycosyltransferase involved in cell wall biosynthesis